MINEIVQAKPETFSGIVTKIKCPIGSCVTAVLKQASTEKRLTIGLSPASKYLTKNCNRALFCITAQAPPGDSATHMQEVLLQAICYENGIYLIKVDSQSKLKKVISASDDSNDYSCVLVHYPYTDPYKDSQELENQSLSPTELDLIDYCEEIWGYETPVIKLPEK